MIITLHITWRSLVVWPCISVAIYCIGSVALDYRHHPKVQRVLWGVNRDQ